MRLPGLLVLAALLLAGCASPAPPASKPAPSGTVTVGARFAHEHAGWAMFLLGERVNFTDAAYDLASVRNLSAHLHVAEEHGGGIVHIEGDFRGGAPDVTLQGFLRTLGVQLTGAGLTLDTRDHHNGTTWNGTAQLRWRVLTGAGESGNTTWRDAREGALLPLRDGLRVLLTYGAAGDDVARQGEAVPFPPVPRSPTPQPA